MTIIFIIIIYLYSNRLLMVLSVGDILTALIYIPTHIIVVHFSSEASCIGYSIDQFLSAFLGSSVAILTSFICIDRYFFVTRPYRNSFGLPASSSSSHEGRSTTKMSTVYCIVTYFVASSLGIFVVFITLGLANMQLATIYNIVLIALYSLALLASLVFNYLLIRYVYSESKQVKRLSINRVFVKKSYRNIVTKTVLMISGIQIFTTMPWVTSMLIIIFVFTEEHYQKYASQIYYMHLWLRMPMLLNSFLNAIVFIHRNGRLIQFYRNLFARTKAAQQTATPVTDNVAYIVDNSEL